MKKESTNWRSNCPINFALETLGDKWTLLIIRDLMFKGKTSFGEFLQSQEKISTNILSARLAKLEEHGLIGKSVAIDKRSKVFYSLTSKGKDLLPIMLEITAWSAKHDSATNTPKSFLKQFAASKKDMIAMMSNEQ